MINLKQILITALFISAITSALFADQPQYSVIKSTEHTFHVKINFDKPELKNDHDRVFASYPGARYYSSANNAQLPVLTRLFNLADNTTPNIKISGLKKNSIKVKNYLVSKAGRKTNPVQHTKMVDAKYLGLFNSIPLYSLEIFPVTYNVAEQTIEWVEEMEIIVSSSRAVTKHVGSKQTASLHQEDFLSKALLNDTQVYAIEEPASNVSTSSVVEPNTDFLDGISLAYKFSINQNGIYKITYDDLLDTDFPIDEVNPTLLSLFNKGRQIPIYFHGAEDGSFDDGDYFEFWGEKNEKTFLNKYRDVYADPFSDINKYWLISGSKTGYRLAEESGGLIGTSSGYIFQPYAYTESLHFEKNKFHENSGHYSDGLNLPSYQFDHWYFDSGISAPEGVAYDFYLPHPFESGSNVVVNAAFRGKSYYKYPTNLLTGHQVELKLRGKGDVAKLVGKITPSDSWRDQDLRFISNADSVVKLSQSFLENGVNRLEVDMFQTGVTDIVLLNWFEIDYLRKYRAHENYIKFHVDSDFFNNSYVNLGDTIQINIDGFNTEDISVYKLGVSKIFNGKLGTIIDGVYTSFGMSIQDQIFDPAQEYVAVTEAAKMKPLNIELYRPWKTEQPDLSLLDRSNSAEYLIITENLFYENTLRLKTLKEEQGFQSEIVTVQNIYDTFNYGIKSPLAIKKFLGYALHNWSSGVNLKYVVFVGKASYNYSTATDLVPTFMFQTESYGAAASDYWYALLDGDDFIPEVSVARIPAATNQDLINYLDKIEEYQDPASGVDEWRNRALFISGNDAASGDLEYFSNDPIFRAQSLRLMDMQLPTGMIAHRLNTVKDEEIEGYDPNFGSTTDLIEYFDNGVSFINFLGHGGGGIWADVSLLNLSDVDRLNNNDKLPFVASMTCFTGAFENPNRLGLAEKLVLAEERGAIAVLAASGVGWKYNDFAIEWSLFELLWDKQLTFGQAVDLMKIYYLANSLYITEDSDNYTPGHGSLRYSMVAQFNLFGDPALKIKQPQNSIQVSVSNSSPVAGDTVKITFSGGVSSGNGHIIIIDGENEQVYENFFSYPSLNTFDFPVPDDAAGQTYIAKIYLNNGAEDANGYVKINIEQPIIESVAVLPDVPEVNIPLNFSVEISNHISLNRMTLKNFRNFNQSFGSSEQVEMEKVNDTLFTSLLPFSGFTSGGVKYFDVSVTDDSGHVTLLRRKKLNILDTRPDLKIKTGSLGYTGTDKLQITFIVDNETDSSLSNVKINCFDQQGIISGQPFAEPIIAVSAHEEKTVIVDYDTIGISDTREFRIVLDPEAAISEISESNNILQTSIITDHVFIDKNLGTSLDGLQNGTISLNSKWLYHVASDALPVSAVVQFQTDDISDFIRSGNQNGLKYVPLLGFSDSSSFSISYPAGLEGSSFNATLSVQVDTQQVSEQDQENVALFKYDAFLNLWLRSSAPPTDGLVSASIDKSGQYAVYMADDEKVPSIEVTANGRPLIQNMLVLRKPIISLLLQDENGVNFTNSLNVLIDDIPLILEGNPQVQQEITIPDTLQNAKAISISTSPVLEAGPHTLSIQVSDVNGNLAEESIEFMVTNEFDIRVFGNYPNPFSDETIISYYVDADNIIDDFSIKIYSTSGRLVRSKMLTLDETLVSMIEPIKAPFHHELIWDGTDDDGVQVANGVYFVVVSGKYKNKTVQHTLKIARLR